MHQKMRVLIVEDDKKIAEILSDYLEKENFSVSILNSGDLVISKVRQSPPDAVLLDLMLPGKDGLSICREIRSFSKVPILIISAKVEEIDRLLGLEMGADDYICKPFSPREVVARIKTVLRRVYYEPSEETLRLGPISINPKSHTATVGDSVIHLTPDEFELLKFLLSRPDYVFSRSDIVFKVLGHNFDGSDRTVDSHIKNLRKKIDEVLPGKEIIQTVYGVGYKISSSLSE
jgi:two-component system, OmpR family, response regulator BaeR